MCAICRAGSDNAAATMSRPADSSGFNFNASSRVATRTSATPPPGTMPSSTAERVAASASSTCERRASRSTSVAAPTRSTAITPASRARRSRSASRSLASLLVFSAPSSCAMRARSASVRPPPCNTNAWSTPAVTLTARPRCSGRTADAAMPVATPSSVAPVINARSSSNSRRAGPGPGVFTARPGAVPRRRFTTMTASASVSMSSHTHSSGRCCAAECSSAGTISAGRVSTPSTTSTSGCSSVTSMSSASVTK